MALIAIRDIIHHNYFNIYVISATQCNYMDRHANNTFTCVYKSIKG